MNGFFLVTSSLETRTEWKIQKVSRYPFREMLISTDFDQCGIFVTVNKPNLICIIKENPVYIKIHSLCFIIFKLFKKVCVGNIYMHTSICPTYLSVESPETGVINGHDPPFR